MSHPRRLPPTNEERVRNAVRRYAPGSGAGGTRFAHPVDKRTARDLTLPVAVVEHGDDGSVERPGAVLVMWVGAATPDNGADYDLWYPSTL